MQVSNYKKEPFTPSPALPHRFADTSQPVHLFQSRKKTFGKQDQTQGEEQRFASPSKANYATNYASHPFPVARKQWGNFTFPAAQTAPRATPWPSKLCARLQTHRGDPGKELKGTPEIHPEGVFLQSGSWLGFPIESLGPPRTRCHPRVPPQPRFQLLLLPRAHTIMPHFIWKTLKWDHTF